MLQHKRSIPSSTKTTRQEHYKVCVCPSQYTKDKAMKYNPHYLVLNQEEIHKLVKHNVGRSVWAVYSCLCAFTGKKQSCFPSHSTIKEWLKADYAMETISRAISTLVKHGVIEKRNRTSKERFKMTFRFIVQGVKGLVKAGQSNMSEPSSQSPDEGTVNIHKERKKNIYKYKSKSSHQSPQKKKYKPKKKKSILHWFDFGQDEEAKSPGEQIFSRLVALSPTLAPSILTEEERLSLYVDLSTPTKQNEEWISWAKEIHGSKIPTLMKQLEVSLSKDKQKKPDPHYERGEINSLSF